MGNATLARRLMVLVVASLLAGTGCRARVEDLSTTPTPTQYRPLVAYALVAGVTGPSGQRAVSGGLQEGFADFLANEQLFAEVVFPYTEGRDDVDIVIEVAADGAFEEGGGANFATWFPGGLLFMPTFRGTRWTYKAHADVTVRDAQTGQPIGQYRSETEHMSVHQSASPFHFVGTVLIVPSLIKAFKVRSPKRPYTDMIYAEAFPSLWKQITAQMVAQEPEYLARAQQAASRRQYAQPAPGGSQWAQPAPAPSWGPAPGRVSPPPPPPRARPVDSAEYGELYSRQVAVVVGIERYQNRPSLRGASSGARRMAAHLRNAGFDPVIEIYDQDASRQRLLEVLGNELGGHVDKDALVLVYFAGHGDTETLPGGAKRGYLIPWDADDDTFSSGISMDTVRDLSNRMTAKHVLYAVDACYSGIPRTRGIRVPRHADSDYLRKITSKRAVQLLVAGSEGEQPVEPGGESVFTSFLLRGLQGEADSDGDGAVTASELNSFVVPEVTRATGARQTPALSTMEGSGEVVFLSP